MKGTFGFTPSRPNGMICPFCEAYNPCLANESQVDCNLCARAVEGAVPWAAGACPAWRPGQTRVRVISYRDARHARREGQLPPLAGSGAASLEANAAHTGPVGNPHR
jgi:hypothetical protein